VLSIKRLSKAYVAGKPVLIDIDLEIASRGITAIIGASGTGKSTLIRCINRLVEPTSGAIEFEGRDLVKLSRGSLRQARRHIGMVFQEYNLVERLTVMENLLSAAWATCRRGGRGGANFRRPTSRVHSNCSMSWGWPDSPISAQIRSPAASGSGSVSRAR
jgi:ABC-type polar amino acid transport system ATPase subunit